MESLDPLGLTTGWMYETILCSYLEGRPHAAPAGVRTDDGTMLSLDLYESSRSLRAVLAAGAFAIDFPRDATSLFDALSAPDDLAYSAAPGVNAPCLQDSCATVGLTLVEARHDGRRTRLVGAPVSLTVRGDLRLVNRAESMLLESLIVVSRAQLLGPEETAARLSEYRRVADKVAPGSAYARRIDLLLRGQPGQS